MFNHPSVRPIGSKQFERHLVTLMIKAVELDETAKEAIPNYPLVLKSSQNDRVEYDPIMEGYKDLYFAIYAQAVSDYLYSYEKMLELELKYGEDYPNILVWRSRCLQLENEYFRQDDDRSVLLDTILREICHRDYKLQDRIRRVKRARLNCPGIASYYTGEL